MPIDFPNSPALNQVYTDAGRSWKWNGVYWESLVGSGPTGPSGEAAFSTFMLMGA